MAYRSPQDTRGAVRPNAGLQALYQARLDRLLQAMAADVSSEVLDQYAADPPEAMTTDAVPAGVLRRLIRRLSRRWQRRFDEAAPALATYFATDAATRTNAQFRKIMRDAGFTVQFKMTPTMRDAYQAVISENVGLIKSIPQQYLKNVEVQVMQSVQLGRDLHVLSAGLIETYGVSNRRAATIARDQNNKATAVFTKTRQTELGITHATWLHSHGGKKPRPSHLAFSGQVYEIAKGAYLEGKWTWPGVEINCRCVSRSIIPGINARTPLTNSSNFAPMSPPMTALHRGVTT